MIATRGTLLALDFINNLIYSPEGKKMTRNDKKAIIRKTQNNIIETYNKIFESDTKSHPIILNGEDSVKQVEEALKKATDRSDYIKNPPFGGFFITCSPRK